jgi:hypothetical protein
LDGLLIVENKMIIFLCTVAYLVIQTVSSISPSADPLLSLLLTSHFKDKWEIFCQDFQTGFSVGRNDTKTCDNQSIYGRESLSFRSLALIHPLKNPVSSLNFVRMKNFLHKLSGKEAESIVIAVLGGSMTAGRGAGGIPGTWPTRIQEYFESEYNKKNLPKSITVLNLATAATSTIWALNRFDTLIPHNINIDLIIFDYDINDCALMQDDYSSRRKVQAATELAIRKTLSLTHSHHGPHSSKENDDIKGPAIMFSNVAVNHDRQKIHMYCGNFYSCYSIGDFRYEVAAEYSVPILSQRYALFSNHNDHNNINNKTDPSFSFLCQPPNSLWPCYNFCSHPTKAGHETVARLFIDFFTGESFTYGSNSSSDEHPVIKNYDINIWSESFRIHPFVAQYESTVSPTVVQQSASLPKKPLLNETQSFEDVSCSSFNVLYDAQFLYATTNNTNDNHHHHHIRNSHFILSDPLATPDKPEPIIIPPKETSSNVSLPVIYSNSSCWQMAEDVQGKPGWITEHSSCLSESINFFVTFGVHPILSINYLSSYTNNMGMAEIEISKLPVRYDPSCSPLPQDFSLSSPPSLTGSICFNNQEQLMKLVRSDNNEEFFHSLIVLDGLRQEDENFKFSVNQVLAIIPDDGRGLISGHEVGEKIVPQDWMMMNETYMLRIKSVDSESGKYPKKNKMRRTDSKFKLYSVSSC